MFAVPPHELKMDTTAGLLDFRHRIIVHKSYRKLSKTAQITPTGRAEMMP